MSSHLEANRIKMETSPLLLPSLLTVCSREVRVMNRRKSSQPEDTETVEVFAFIRASVACLMSSRSPAIVPAGKYQNGVFHKPDQCSH